MDWSRIIADLRASGLVQTEIAKHVGCTQSTISELANGQKGRVSFETGSALVALWRDRCAEPPRQEPAKDAA